MQLRDRTTTAPMPPRDGSSRSSEISSSVAERLPRLLATCGLAGVLVLPPVGLLFGGMDGLPLHAFSAALIAAGAVLRAAREGRLTLRPSLPALGALLFLAGALVATFQPGAPVDRERALFRVAQAVVHGVTFFALASAFGADAGFRRIALRIAAACLAGHVVVALWMWIGSDAERMGGLFGNPNYLASSVVALALLLAAPIARRDAAASTDARAGRYRVLLCLLAAAALVTVFLSGSRAGTALLFFGAWLLAVLTSPSASDRPRRLLRTGAILVAAAALLFLVPNPLEKRLRAASELDRSYSRTFMWKVALDTLAEEPLGVGPGMNKFVFPRKAYVPEEPELIHRRHDIGIVHNVFLGAGVEFGWLGMAGLLVFFGAFVAGHAGAMLRGRDDARLTGAFLAGLVLLLHAQVDGVDQNPASMAVFAFVLAFHRGLLRSGAGGRPAARAFALPRMLQWPAAAVAWALLAAVPAAGVVFARSDELVRRGYASLRGGYERAALESFVAARALIPFSAQATRGLAETYYLTYVESLEAGAPDQTALEFFFEESVKLRDLNPLDATTGIAHGDRLQRLHVLTEGADSAYLAVACAAYTQALDADPYDLETLFDRGRVHWLLGDAEAARRDYEAVLALEPDYVPAYKALAILAERAGRKEEAHATYLDALHAFSRCNALLVSHRYGDLPRLRSMLDDFDEDDILERIARLEIVLPPK